MPKFTFECPYGNCTTKWELSNALVMKSLACTMPLVLRQIEEHFMRVHNYELKSISVSILDESRVSDNFEAVALLIKLFDTDRQTYNRLVGVLLNRSGSVRTKSTLFVPIHRIGRR